ncbi:hypothetical protein SLEP1_g2363 [Rubroshorea leprosula]|uniref:CCHC-type domain-containing protein n=1 Tax=Rubroshorea leprosula TaxID=152421 RepID=A0AAV5HQ79_9ROSI|nr:hypothetical protein SLEP1_g2363 [Rubroshorea leprosula]
MANANFLSLKFSSTQETDLLARSVKRVKGPSVDVPYSSKEETMAEAASTAPSYRDKLLLDGLIDSSNVDLSFDAIPEYFDEDSDIDDDPNDPAPIVLFSKEDKKRMRDPWKNALIIKTFNKTVGYTFLYASIKAQWKPTGKWECIDLGLDYFLVRFQDQVDLNKVINGGPWFVGSSYLTIRPWEPNFKPESATFSHTVIWAQLPGLSAEYYDPISLHKIGNTIGTLLRVDAHTAHHTRGQYARVCVRVDLNKPLVKIVRLGKIRQKVAYEGIRGLCFSCGRIGHRKEQCTFKSLVATPVGDRSVEAQRDGSIESINKQVEATPSKNASEDEFGPWLIVERRKKKKPVKVMLDSLSFGRNSNHRDYNEHGDSYRNVGSAIQPTQQGPRPRRANEKMTGALNVKSQFKPVNRTETKMTVNSSDCKVMDSRPNGVQASSVPASKGKEVLEVGTLTTLIFEQSNNPTPSMDQPIKDLIKTNGLSKPITSKPHSLEVSLLSVKDRIKNLEKGCSAVIPIPSSGSSFFASQDLNHGQPKDITNTSTAQPQLASPPDAQRENDTSRGSTRSDTILEGENTPTMEGGGPVSSLAQPSCNPQIHRSNSFSNLGSNTKGRYDHLSRSVQYSKARIQFRRSRHRKEAGPYSTPEIHVLSMRGAPSTCRDEGKCGEDPCYHQIPDFARKGGGSGVRVPNAPVSLSECNNDVAAQGNQGANV